MVLKSFFYFTIFIRAFLGPCLFFFFLIVPQTRRRLKLERKLSFQSDSFQRAHLLVHVSSEGELEQALPVIKHFLEKKGRVQILFTSLSVQNKIEKLFKKYPQQIDYRLLPLLHYPWGLFWAGGSLGKWIKAPLCLMVRYDFFPELVLTLKKKSIRFGLLSATFKGKYHLFESGLINKIRKFFWHSLLGQFDFIFCSISKDLKFLEKIFKKTPLKQPTLYCFEFRMEQIITRLKRAPEVLKSSPQWESLTPFFQAYPPSQRVIMGSAWQKDLEILSHPQIKSKILNKELGVFIAPHLLTPQRVSNMEKRLREMSKDWKINILTHNESRGELKKGELILSQIPGVLCEMYSLFEHIYVGGGFGRSLHSLLEPFWTGAHLYFGPRTQRSTEYDFVWEMDRDRAHQINSPLEFGDLFEKISGTHSFRESVLEKRRRQANQYLKGVERAFLEFDFKEDHHLETRDEK